MHRVINPNKIPNFNTGKVEFRHDTKSETCYGYTVKLATVDTISSRLLDSSKCPICLEIKPTQYRVCTAHYQCRPCLRKQLEPAGSIETRQTCAQGCKISQNEIEEYREAAALTSSKTTPLACHPSRETFGLLQIHCPFSDQCNETITLGELEKYAADTNDSGAATLAEGHHLFTCGYIPVVCDCCNDAMLLSELSQHREKTEHAKTLSNYERKVRHLEENKKRTDSEIIHLGELNLEHQDGVTDHNEEILRLNEEILRLNEEIEILKADVERNARTGTSQGIAKHHAQQRISKLEEQKKKLHETLQRQWERYIEKATEMQAVRKEMTGLKAQLAKQIGYTEKLKALGSRSLWEHITHTYSRFVEHALQSL